MNNEIWKPIPGYGGHYEVSNMGNIRVKDRTVSRRHSSNGCMVEFSYKGRELKKTPGKYGHLSVHLGVDGEKFKPSVHRLVLIAFVGPPPEGHEACHCNGDPSDNRLENLRWDTHYENNQDRKRHNRYAKGQTHVMSKLTNTLALTIYQSDEPGHVLAARHNVSPTVISSIRNGRSWSAITGGIPRGLGESWRKRN